MFLLGTSVVGDVEVNGLLKNTSSIVWLVQYFDEHHWYFEVTYVDIYSVR